MLAGSQFKSLSLLMLIGVYAALGFPSNIRRENVEFSRLN